MLAAFLPAAQAQSGLLEARVIEGDGQVLAPGTRLPRPLVVEVSDETGMRVEDAVVSFLVPEDGATGTFRNGLRTDILRTDANGRVALRNLSAGGLAGQFQVKVTVAKGGARTGALSTQFIAPDTRRHFGLHPTFSRPGGRALEIGGLILAAAAAGYIKEHATGRSRTVEQPPTIGPPVVTIGKP